MKKSLIFGVSMMVAQTVLLAFDSAYLAQHLRKTLNLDTRTDIVVSSVSQASPFGSLKIVPVTINGGTYQIYLSQDEKQYIWGYPVDATVDPDQTRVKGINLKNVHVKGEASAPIAIVEFTDLQCPYCKNVHDIIKKELYTTYTPKEVKLVFKHFPLSMHPWAEKGAVALECAGEQKADSFWKMSDAIYTQAVQISTENVRSKMEGIAKNIGLDTGSFLQCFDSDKYLNVVQSDRREGGLLGVNSTPTLFINGRMLRGIRSFEDIKVVVEEKKKELAKKK